MLATADFESQSYVIGSATFWGCCQEVACRGHNVNIQTQVCYSPTTVCGDNKGRSRGSVQEESVESEEVSVGRWKHVCQLPMSWKDIGVVGRGRRNTDRKIPYQGKLTAGRSVFQLGGRGR